MKKAIIILLVLVCAITSAFAGYYESGDTEFSFRGGVSLPAFQFFPYSTTEKFAMFSDIHMSKVGGFGSLAYQVFVNKKVLIGGEIGYNFVSSLEEKYLAVAPFTAKFTYTPIQNGKFDLNFHSNVGVALLKYNGHRFFPAPFASVAINPVYFFTDNWGAGLEAGIWGCLEAYTSPEKKESLGITSMMPVVLTVTYRH